MKKNEHEAFKKAVWREGFSLEYDIAEQLKISGWEIFPNRYFQEIPSRSLKQYDIAASRSFSQNGYSFSFILVVECKYNADQIVFYIRTADNKEPYQLKNMLGEDLKSIYSWESVKKVFRSIKQYREIFFSEDQVFGYQVFAKKITQGAKGKKKKNKNKNEKVEKQTVEFTPHPDSAAKKVFGALNTVAAAVRHEHSLIVDDGDPKRAYFLFPIVVLSGGLNKAYFRDRKTLKPSSFFRYKTGIADIGEKEPDEYFVHIVDKDGIKKMIKLLNQIFKKFETDFHKTLINLKKNTQTPESNVPASSE